MTAAALFFLSLILFIAARIGQHSHALGYLFLAACIFGPVLWRFAFAIVRDAALAFVIGFFGGLGVRESGVLKQLRLRHHPPRQPRGAHRREGDYFPWNDSLEGIGDD